MLSYVEAVRQARDPEAIHAMRVASRRLRSALTVFGPAFEGPTYRDLQREVRAVTQALGAARDLDVMLDELCRLADSVPAGRRGSIDRFIDVKRRERRLLQPPVTRSLDRLARHDLPAMFARAIAEAVGALEPARDRATGHPEAEQAPEERM